MLNSVKMAWKKYRTWVIERELHLCNGHNPLQWVELIWEAIKTAFPVIAATAVLFAIGLAFRKTPPIVFVTADAIAALALWFGLSRSRDTSIVRAVEEVCHRLRNTNLPNVNGYRHVGDMIGKFRKQLAFYNGAVIAVNVLLFAAGVILSFL